MTMRIPDDVFADLLRLVMEADPWPNRRAIEYFLDEESRERGYCDWMEAFDRVVRLPSTPEDR